jgi:hypothetical protein
VERSQRRSREPSDVPRNHPKGILDLQAAFARARVCAASRRTFRRRCRAFRSLAWSLRIP